MLKNRKEYYYKDDYMFFTFNGVHSSKYNLFVVNNGDGYEWITDTGASAQFESPQYQGYSYYLGTSRTQKTIPFNLIAEGLTQNEMKEMLLWLEEGNTGLLFTDWNIDWGYDVVISKVSNPKMLINSNNSVIEFSIEFTTIGEFRARSPWDITKELVTIFTNDDREEVVANKYGIPEIDLVAMDNFTMTINLPTIGNQYSYIDYKYTAADELAFYNEETQTIFSSLEISFNDNQYIKYDFTDLESNSIFSYYGNIGYLIYNETQLVEAVENLISNNILISINNGIYRLTGLAPAKLNEYNLTPTISGIDLILSAEDKEKLSYMKNVYIAISALKPNNGLEYGKNYTESYSYPFDYYNWIIYYKDGSDIPDIISIPGKNVTEIPNLYFNAYYGTYNVVTIKNKNAKSKIITVHKYNNL